MFSGLRVLGDFVVDFRVIRVFRGYLSHRFTGVIRGSGHFKRQHPAS
jgi:hypothetical protein